MRKTLRSLTVREKTDGISRLLEQGALACILAVLTVRVFIGETFFRTSQIVVSPPRYCQPEAVNATPVGPIPLKPPTELARAGLSMILLVGFVLWLMAKALQREALIRTEPIFIALLGLFIIWVFISAREAIDKRGALTGAFTQVSILLAAAAVMDLVRDKIRRILLVIILASLAGTMGIKALLEFFYEIPQRKEAYQTDPAGQLAQIGITPNTPAAKMFEKRVFDKAVLGYFGLANVFASLLVMIIPAAAGLGIEKLSTALRLYKSNPPERGQVHLPTLSALLSSMIVLIGTAAVFLTRSKGGIIAYVIAIILAGLIIWKRTFFKRNLRKILITSIVLIIAASAVVILYGKLHNGLPTRSMQVRWEYWIGAIRVIKDSPIFGVGPGGFGEAYLAHRLETAAEAVKSPHNFILHAATQYGIVGGIIYIAILLLIFIKGVINTISTEDEMHKVDNTNPGRIEKSPGSKLPLVRWCIFLSVLIALTISAWEGLLPPPGNITAAELSTAIIVEAIVPAAIFAICFLIAAWAGVKISSISLLENLTERFIPIVIICGLAGFLLHNLITFSLWMPATATVFWITSSALLWRGKIVHASRQITLPTILIVTLVVVVAGHYLFWPVLMKNYYYRKSQTAYSTGRFDDAVGLLSRAVNADDFDGISAADLAKMYASRMQWRQAHHYARIAWMRCPTANHAHFLAKTIYSQAGKPTKPVLEMYAKAITLDPMNMRFRYEYAV
ncbi:MAG: O-antigen ligase family protein [Planctomycetes bacterium]|nr:O-antigen ligase family protein [Planctomycetota bacterium]